MTTAILSIEKNPAAKNTSEAAHNVLLNVRNDGGNVWIVCPVAKLAQIAMDEDVSKFNSAIGSLKAAGVSRNTRETIARVKRKPAQGDALIISSKADRNADAAWQESLGKWNHENGQTHTPEYAAT